MKGAAVMPNVHLLNSSRVFNNRGTQNGDPGFTSSILLYYCTEVWTGYGLIEDLLGFFPTFAIVSRKKTS